MGLITFGDVVYRWVELNWFTNKDDLVSSVATIPWSNEDTNTSGAIWYTREMMFIVNQGDRPDARNIRK